jgi:hypothetical protein
MVVDAGINRPVRLSPYIATGAVLGVAVREASASMWPTLAERSALMVFFAVVAAFPLGWTLVVQGRLRLLAVVWGWSGALCSISAISTFALGAPPLWALACTALVPLSAATAVAVGAIVGLRRRQRHPGAHETAR